MNNQLTFLEIAWGSKEYDDAVELRNRILRLPLGLTLTDEDIESERDQSHYAALIGDRLVGCITAVTQRAEKVKLRQMAIDPAYQRNGIGTFLIDHAEKELARRDANVVVLHARKTAVGFYQKLGYQVDGDEFVEVTLPHVLMTKNLSW